MQQVRSLAAKHLQTGGDRIALYLEITKLNEGWGRPFQDADIKKFSLEFLLNESANNVHQERQSPKSLQETQRNTTNTKSCSGSAAQLQTCSVSRDDLETFERELASDVTPSLPLERYLWLLAQAHGERLDDYCREGDEWESSLFWFLRHLKAHPDMTQMSPAEAYKQVDAILPTWRSEIPEDMRPREDWAFWLGVDSGEAETEFFGVWKKIRFLPGRSPLQNAHEMAKETPVSLPERLVGERPARYVEFLGIAGWLQLIRGTAPIYLPVEELSEILQVKPFSVSRYRRWAVEDGFMDEVRAAERSRQPRQGKATEFRFHVRKVKELAAVLERSSRGGSLS